MGSLNNINHKPGGGEKKIFDDKDYIRQTSAVSSDHNSMSGSQVSDEESILKFTNELISKIGKK